MRDGDDVLVPALDADGATDADAVVADVPGDGALAGAEHEISSAATSATREVVIATSLARLRCSPAEAEQIFKLTQRFVDALRAR